MTALCCGYEARINGVLHVCNRPGGHLPPHMLDLFASTTPREPIAPVFGPCFMVVTEKPAAESEDGFAQCSECGVVIHCTGPSGDHPDVRGALRSLLAEVRHVPGLSSVGAACLLAAERILARRRYELQLAIEEGEGRPDSSEARFARAMLAGDGATMSALCAESGAEYFRKWGHWPQEDIREKARAMVEAERAERERESDSARTDPGRPGGA